MDTARRGEAKGKCACEQRARLTAEMRSRYNKARAYLLPCMPSQHAPRIGRGVMQRGDWLVGVREARFDTFRHAACTVKLGRNAESLKRMCGVYMCAEVLSDPWRSRSKYVQSISRVPQIASSLYGVASQAHA